MAKKKDNDLSAAESKSENDLLSNFAEGLNKAAGRKVAYLMDKDAEAFTIRRFSSLVLALDVAMGGGYPLGRDVFFFGKESSCKSTLMYLAMASLHEYDKKRAVYLEDAENALDLPYAIKLGVDSKRFQAVRSYSAEEAIEFFRSGVASGAFSGLFLDSWSAIQPEKLVEGDGSTQVMGGIGRITSTGLSNIEKDKFKCASEYGFMPVVFYSSQVKKKVGVMWGSPDTNSGGTAPGHYASIRIDLTPGEHIIENDVIVAKKFTFITSKNKTYDSHIRGEFIMMSSSGDYKISNEATLMDMAVKSGIIEKKGSWYSYLGSNLAQGAINAAKVIENFPTEEKNKMLDLCMNALHPNMKLAFRFKDDTRTTVREETVEKCQEES